MSFNKIATLDPINGIRGIALLLLLLSHLPWAQASPEKTIALPAHPIPHATTVLGEAHTTLQQEDRSGKSYFFLEALKKSFFLIIHMDRALFIIIWTSLWIALSAVCIASLFAIPLGLLVALHPFPGRPFLLSLLNTMMALPTVIVGLLLYGILNRQGLLGEFGLLFTPIAIVIGQCILITPIIWNLTIVAINHADPRLRLTCLTLGANTLQQGMIFISELKFAIIAAIVTAFGRAIGEVGIAMMLGGNIEGFTRTMTTAIALEANKGEFEFSLALGIMLLLVALLLNMLLQRFQKIKN